MGECSVEEEAFEYAAQYNALMHTCLIVLIILIGIELDSIFVYQLSCATGIQSKKRENKCEFIHNHSFIVLGIPFLEGATRVIQT